MDARDVVSVFESAVRRSPGATAIAGGGERVSYGALNRRANKLARWLIGHGITPGSFVGLCLPRTADAIVAMLATLKAGAAYVPVDPAFPRERIRLMLEDAGVRLTIDAPVDASQYDDGDLGLSIAPTSPAYVMYTSGTTGAPKGAALPHSGIVRLVWQADYLPLESRHVVLHHSTCAFDAATFEVWAPLLNGGTLVLHPKRLELDTLGATLRENAITTLLLTTSVFHLVVEHALDALAPLEHVVTGGDVMQAALVKRAIARHPHLRIINGYGPTENTTFTTCFVITRETTIGDTVPIGRPIGGTRVFVIDGELYTNGLGLAHGYLNRDELTRERFVDSPYGRMYKTGDRVWQGPDGLLHFLGRADGQVKIRGFRIEPGEVEHALRQLPGVADAVCLAETIAGEKQLVAYVRGTADGAQLREQLSERVPSYLVPGRIHVLAELPLTHNGKIDRQRLPALVAAAVPPTDDVVLDEWRRQLQAPALPPDASIYDFGASSLTVMVVQSRLNEMFRCAVGPAELAQAHTPREWTRIYRTRTNP